MDLSEQFNSMHSLLWILISTLGFAGQEVKQEIAKMLIEQGIYKSQNRLISFLVFYCGLKCFTRICEFYYIARKNSL